MHENSIGTASRHNSEYNTTFTQARVEVTGNLIPKWCALRDEANAFHRQVQTNALEITRRNSKEECIRISHVHEAK